jgi:hypothetical protein
MQKSTHKCGNYLRKKKKKKKENKMTCNSSRVVKEKVGSQDQNRSVESVNLNKLRSGSVTAQEHLY